MTPKNQAKLTIPKSRRHKKQGFKNKSVENECILKIGGNGQDEVQNYNLVHPERLLGETDKMLRAFDLNYKYGPCVGMKRIDRWERAKNLGLNPPESVKDSLVGYKASMYQESLFSQIRCI
ncbi:DNA polymerase delta, subunit 4-domain-containing protein [Helicostylum pulchrum]|nr:DNA polymerase delta, subunit 4-domain-containing protein [Helicostylum pulchrum]